MPRFHRVAPLLFCLLLAVAAQAQTYFYVDDIGIYPGTPTDQQVVEIQLSGNLSNTGSYVSSVTADVSAFTVAITVVAGSNGGMQVLVPHTVSVFTGPLPAGTYTITIGGSGVGDFAPNVQHVFAVIGGAPTACDSLVIAGVQWSPFSDSLITVHVFNPTGTLFDYPGFLLLGIGGDTLAQETVNLFGIGEESWHTLTVRPGVELPTGIFNATLELWTGFYEDLACSWALPILLCSEAPCSPLVPFVQNYGSGLAMGDFQYVISSGGSPVAGGTFTLTADDQLASDTVCLPPGNYVMELTALQPSTGGEPVFGVNGEDWAQGPSANVGFDIPASLTFAFHGPCIDIAQHVVIRNPDALRVIQGTDHIQLTRTDGQALELVNVFDAQGRVVYSTGTSQAECTIPTGAWPAGIFMLRVSSGKQPLVVKVTLP